MSARVVTVNEVLDGHVALDIECLDRVYLNAYVPILQSSGQVVAFMTQYLNLPIPSPVIFDKMGQRFRRSVASFADANHIPWVRFAKDDRKAEVMRPVPGPAGGHRAVGGGGDRGGAGVPAGLDRLSAADPYRGAAVHLRQGRPAGDLLLLLPVGSGLRPGVHQGLRVLPLPGQDLGQRPRVGQAPVPSRPGSATGSCPTGSPPATTRPPCSRSATGCSPTSSRPSPSGGCTGCRCRSARTMSGPGTGGSCRCARSRSPAPSCFDAPRRARAFFEALIGDNLDIGRPANVELIFNRHIRRDTPGVFRTAIDRPAIGPDSGGVVLNVFYKHSRVKQYLKDGRAMRIETVVNAPRDLGCNARLHNLAELQDKARGCNRRILEAERAGQGTVLASPAFERIAHPSVRRGRAEDPGPAVRRSSGPGPGRCLVHHPASSNWHHEQEPACLDDRAAARPLQPRPDDLRPAPAPAGRADPPDRAHQPLRPDPRRA